MTRNCLKAAVAAILGAIFFLGAVPTALASPASVTITGNLQSELGCSSDFDPGCSNSMLAYTPGDAIWRGSFVVPAGNYQYFAALDGDITKTYGLHGGNALTPIPLTLASPKSVKFYYDDASHWITDNINSTIAGLAGSFQSELGCSSDFDPGCLRSWLQDIDGDGIYTFSAILPAGSYSTIVAIDESFSESYGKGGLPLGGNYDFVVTNHPVGFRYDAVTHLLQIDTGSVVGGSVPEPSTWSMLVAGLGLLGWSLRRRRHPRALVLARA